MAFPIDENKENHLDILNGRSDVIHILRTEDDDLQSPEMCLVPDELSPIEDKDTGRNTSINVYLLDDGNEYFLCIDSFKLNQSRGRKSEVRRKNNSTGFTSRSVLLLFVLAISSTEAISKIEFQLMTRPAYFGSNITVWCRMPTTFKLAVNHMAWFLDNTIQVALNSNSYFPSKYNITINYGENYTNYYLTILRLDEEDVNIVYRCDFGFESHSEVLNLKDQHFISLPNRNLIQESFYATDKSLKGIVRIPKVYPMPRCDILYEKQNYTKATIMTSVNRSVFYDVTLAVAPNETLSSCHGELNISCYFGTKYMLLIHDRVKLCNDTIEEISQDGQFNAKLVIALSFVGTLIVAAVVCVLCRKQLKELIRVLRSKYNAVEKNTREKDPAHACFRTTPEVDGHRGDGIRSELVNHGDDNDPTTV